MQVPVAKPAALAYAETIRTEEIMLVLSFLAPEDALRARAASTTWRRLASDDDVWRSFFGELLAAFTAVSSWPARGPHESCARWYFRCRAYARWAQGAGESYDAGLFPYLNMHGTLTGSGAELVFEPDAPLAFPAPHGLLAELVRLERRRGASNTESFACATSYFNHISGVPASLRIRIKGCFDLIGAWKSNHGVDALSRLLAAQYTPATTVAAPPPPMIPPGVRERLVTLRQVELPLERVRTRKEAAVRHVSVLALENERLRSKLAVARETIAAQAAEIMTLKAENLKLKAKVAHLTKRVEELERTAAELAAMLQHETAAREHAEERRRVESVRAAAAEAKLREMRAKWATLEAAAYASGLEQARMGLVWIVERLGSAGNASVMSPLELEVLVPLPHTRHRSSTSGARWRALI
jgi:FtsZ-binding cell division protein ZapB